MQNPYKVLLKNLNKQNHFTYLVTNLFKYVFLKLLLDLG